MPRTTTSVPKYRKHRQSGQGIVTLRDSLTGVRRDVLLGKFGSAASRAEYQRVVLCWEANSRRLPGDTQDHPDLTVNEVLAAFWDHAEVYYNAPEGNPTLANFRFAVRPLKRLYGETPAAAFDQRALKTIRQQMITAGLARKNINGRIGKIKQVFKWAAEEQLVPASVFHALLTVSGLKQGRSEARETAPVRPVPRAVVEDTIAHLTPTVAAMVCLQLETGMRPGELVRLRACDIDMSGRVWLYKPAKHKTAHFGHERIVPIGPKGQEIVRRFLSLDTEAFLFSPARAVQEQAEERRRNRKTPLWESHLKAQARRRSPSRMRPPGDHYGVGAYAKAIQRGCDQANPLPEHLAPRMESAKAWWARLTAEEQAEVRVWRKAHRWHPHRLRHTRATEIRREAGLDAARAILGHKSLGITETYAELDQARATEVMGKIG